MSHPEVKRITHSLENVETFPAEGLLKEGHRHYFVVKRNHRFTLVLAPTFGLSDHPGKLFGWYNSNALPEGEVYYPVHSSVTRADVENARFYWDDGKAWHFAHCSPDEQVDFAAEVEQFTFNEFTETILFQNTKGAQATNNIVRSTAWAKGSAILEFARAAGRAAHAAVIATPLGTFHRDPHRDHKREQAIAAINKVNAAWLADTNKQVAQGHASEAITAVKTRLGSTHTIQTWPEAREADRPKIKAQIAALSQVVGGVSTTLSMAQYFKDDDPLTYTAESADTDVATATANGGSVVVAPVGAGSTTVTIRATDTGERFVEQSFAVNVVTV